VLQPVDAHGVAGLGASGNLQLDEVAAHGQADAAKRGLAQVPQVLGDQAAVALDVAVQLGRRARRVGEQGEAAIALEVAAQLRTAGVVA
jgi:methionine aminopeptidase